MAYPRTEKGARSSRDAIRELRARIAPLEVEDDKELVLKLSMDTYWKAQALASAGRPMLADGVVRPTSAHEVATILKHASALGIPVVTRGGGSGSEGGAVPDRGGIVIDMSGLNKILGLDENSCTVRVQAGLNGMVLESFLNERGYMLPHYPASVHLATVGGYLAAKGSGTLSTKYGKIEDLVMSIEAVLPSGQVIRTLPVPRHSVGPDLNQVFIGSEGTLGVITEATLQVRRQSDVRAFRIVSFPDIESGLHALRRILQVGWRPMLIRLFDPEATQAHLARVLDRDISGVQAVIGFDGPRSLVDLEVDEVLGSLAQQGGKIGDAEIAADWWENRYKIYYDPHRPHLPKIWGTADIVAPFGSILEAYRVLRQTLVEEFSPWSLNFSGHFSHWYSWGTMIYGRFVVEDPPKSLEESLALYDQIWSRTSEVLIKQGSVINDHHGIGLKLTNQVASQWASAWSVLEMIKAALDPAGVMNPGKLGLGRH